MVASRKGSGLIPKDIWVKTTIKEILGNYEEKSNGSQKHETVQNCKKWKKFIDVFLKKKCLS